uniref:Secreted protein n=1 Tax=Salix viminalis TaxID=40686 RepID=A0A6N2K5G3_SALVM
MLLWESVMMFWLSGNAAVVMMERKMLKTALSIRGSYNVKRRFPNLGIHPRIYSLLMRSFIDTSENNVVYPLFNASKKPRGRVKVMFLTLYHSK